MGQKINFELLNQAVDRIFSIFRDSELRTFVVGRKYNDNDAGKKELLISLSKNADAIFSTFFGITNCIYAYLVASFSDNMTVELAYADDVIDNSKSFCVERVEDALFGLYDTYDATDDLVKFVVFNAALAVGNDPKLQNDLGFKRSSSFNEYHANGNSADQENLLSIFRWMFNLRKLVTNRRIGYILEHYDETINKLIHLMDYASFFSDISLQKDSDSDSYNFVLQNGKVVKTNFVILKVAFNFFLLRSVETKKTDNKTSMVLKYSRSNESETAAKISREIVGWDAAPVEPTDEGAGIPRIKVKSVGETYSEITNGLMRKRSRSTFCGGLSGYKYYTELAASIIDAIEIIANNRTGKSVVTYLLPLIKNQKNFSICKDECVCIRPSCRNNDKKLCKGTKTFDQADFNYVCLSSMRLLPILTLLLIVAGSKSILPQVFECVTDNPDPEDLFKEINKQLSMRFTNYNPIEVDKTGKQIYNDNLYKSSLTLNARDERSLPRQVLPAVHKLKARAYTVAIVNELERIENSFDKKKISIGNYSIKEMFDAMDEFLVASSEDTFDSDVKYAKQCLRQVLMTVLCYYRGLSSCIAEQFEYEVDLENSLKEGMVNTDLANKKIKEEFFKGVKEELQLLEGDDLKDPHIPTFYELFNELKNLNSRSSNDINMALGRDMLDVHELFRNVQIDPESEICLIYSNDPKTNSSEWINLDEEYCSCSLSNFFIGIKNIIGYFYDRNVEHGIGIYPQVLTFSSTMINRDGNIIRKFMFYTTESRSARNSKEKEYNVFSFFDYEINKRYFFVPPKKYENSNWLTHPILIGCAEFCDAVFDNLPKGGQI